MPDWRQEVKERLGHLRIGAETEAAICSELSSHLEEAFEEFRRRGFSEQEAVARTLSLVSDWAALSRRIRRVYLRERAEALLMPGLVGLALCVLSMRLPPMLGFPVKYSFAWRQLGHATIVVDLPFLLLLPAVGTVAAGLARWVGGDLRARILACSFALIPPCWWGVEFLVFEFARFAPAPDGHAYLWMSVSSLLSCAILPAIATFAGAALFARGENPPSSPSSTLRSLRLA